MISQICVLSLHFILVFIEVPKWKGGYCQKLLRYPATYVETTKGVYRHNLISTAFFGRQDFA